MQTARFFLDAADNGRVALGCTTRNSLSGGAEFAPEPSLQGGQFRQQQGDTADDGTAKLAFRVGDRLFRVFVTSEIAPIEAEA